MIGKKRKAILIVAMVTLLVTSLCACEKRSEAAKAADDLITAIGTVGLDSEQAISAAEKAVSELTEEEAKSLEGLEVLKNARQEYDALVDAKVIAEVEEKISAIGTVSLDSEEKIKVAQEAYDELEERLKSKVSNSQDLEKSKADLAEAQIKVQAEEIETLISAIGTVNTKSKSAIDKARSAYDKAPKNVQERVSNFSVLTAAEETFTQVCVTEIEDAISAIGNVTIESQAQIETARKKYERAPKEVKEEVSNYNILTEAEKTYRELKEEEQLRSMTINQGDTVTSTDWKITLKKAYTSTELKSNQSSTSWEASDGYAFLVLEFDITCLNSTHPTIDDQGITNIIATVKGNTYSSWEYQYISSQLWLYIRHTYLDANLPLHIYVYTYVPKANMKDTITVNLKIAGKDKIIMINK